MSTAATAEMVAEALKRTPPEGRVRFLRELLACAAAGLTVLEGREASCEAVYRIGDAVVDYDRR